MIICDQVWIYTCDSSGVDKSVGPSKKFGKLEQNVGHYDLFTDDKQ